ncbi:unnamed protein product [Nezara viridula]|uniref:Chitin-binding type-2 domain-containing protein n=1 Tax=Nezara viridula TaxID=85310 RepID=A0A9P0HTZ6_NEZVI|nr:unnamed protein product [Nezara viridula]
MPGARRGSERFVADRYNTLTLDQRLKAYNCPNPPISPLFPYPPTWRSSSPLPSTTGNPESKDFSTDRFSWSHYNRPKSLRNNVNTQSAGKRKKTRKKKLNSLAPKEPETATSQIRQPAGGSIRLLQVTTCVDNYPYLNRCPSGLYFDDINKLCTFKAEARCGPLPTTIAPSTEPPVDLAVKCEPAECQLPFCFCSRDGTIIPGRLDPEKTPQIILLTFDGAVNLNNYDHYKRVFSPDRQNPNGCPIRGTFFVSHEYCNYNMVQSLAHDGHEIGTETISLQQGLQDKGYEEWVGEMLGIWEVPLNAHYVESYEGGHCPYLDQCVLHNHDADEVFEWLREDFERYYDQNRAPYMMPFHTNWFQIKELEGGLHKFIDWAMNLEDVWFVTVTQALTWITDPHPTKELTTFEPWKCNKKDNLPPPPCNLPNKCALTFKPPEANFSTTRYLETCRECPNKYPWLGDSEGTGIPGKDTYHREN